MAHGVTAHESELLPVPLSTLVAHLDFPPGTAGSFDWALNVVSPSRISGVPTTGNAR